ncbi:MAG: cryptochrome/photolyase family protein [Sporocytophaga sp.]|uniref:cryptochrome/photolyase family protein n=1 Tax=Sporocytophaga sp. TaxID=2231183 RepID=UPI001B190519|nr:cryptochrome/photolyase family protein [Sporocytophaga sp.]MBO9703822.1 cryptochrome/photolyase family protein [Sporocytophaga sp.]
MNQAFLIFPHQLFEINFNRKKNQLFCLIEEPLLFTQFKFHKQKLVFHRASMKAYEQQLISKGFKCIYLEQVKFSDTETLFKELIKNEITQITYIDPIDDWLSIRIEKNAAIYSIKTVIENSPMFLNTTRNLEDYFSNNRFHMADFYSHERKRLDLMIDNGKPRGGKWSYDNENRKKLPKNHRPPIIHFPHTNTFVKEAVDYVKKNFGTNPGTATPFLYPISHEEAQTWLNTFINQRLNLFGTYEDAISSKYPFIYHSVISPLLNSGLLTPEDVLAKVMEHQNEIPINALEGFIRQIIGWREYMRAVYLFKGRHIRTENYFNHKRKLPPSFWDASTAILPLDHTISNVLSNSYNHHIERLMIMGNFMLLCETDPDEVYKWFMEMYIDAYDWVMVPNVYGMSQFAAGQVITTKPYISGSNYILKMSDYPRGPWTEIWDSLYWRFIDLHKKKFQSNPRMTLMLRLLDKKDKRTIKGYYDKADKFLEGKA